MKVATASTKNATSKGAPVSRADRLKSIGILLAIMVGALWTIEIIDQITGDALSRYGIHPREVDGLPGILTAPLLHGQWTHLISNTLPFALLAFFVMLRGIPTFVKVTLFTVVVGGLLVWLLGGIGRGPTNHIGASGVIFGYFGFILAAGFFERSLRAIAAAALVAFIYGGMIFGVFPNQPGVSWESHLFGFLAGGGYAFLMSKELRASRAKKKA